MLSWVKELTMNLSRLGAVGFVGFFGGGIRPDVGGDSEYLDGRGPSFVPLPNTLEPRLVANAFGHVPVILACRSLTKIVDAIVQLVAVNVVYLVRKITVNPQPNDSVSKFSLSIDAGLRVSVTANAPFYNTGRCAGNPDKADKLSSGRVVVEKRPNLIGGYLVTLGFAHGLRSQIVGSGGHGLPS
jgi:hypothetical protein